MINQISRILITNFMYPMIFTRKIIHISIAENFMDLIKVMDTVYIIYTYVLYIHIIISFMLFDVYI